MAVQIIEIETKIGTLKFYCPSTGRSINRAKTLLTKEPDTIEWIDTFINGDIFWDIGANVGCYSLYTALKPDIEVLAFEPAMSNYYILNRNIEINKMDGRIFSLCIAFHDTLKLDYLYLSNIENAMSFHGFTKPVIRKVKGKQKHPVFKQGMIGYPIDYFIKQFNPKFPNYIKIDVDGNEDKIIKGALKTISDKRLKSILIELNTRNTKCYKNVTEIMEKAMFKVYSKKKSPIYNKGFYETTYNYIFVRN